MNIPLPDPPQDLTDEEGVRAFVESLHQSHVRQGPGAVPAAFLGVRRHPMTGELFEGLKLLQVHDHTSNGSLSMFAEATRAIAAKSSATMCVTVFPVAVAAEKAPAPFEGGELVLAYLVEHNNTALNRRCWYASLTLSGDTEEPVVGVELREYAGHTEVVGVLANLLPQRTLN